MKEELTPEQQEGLRIARALIDAGVPVFAAAPCPPGCKTPGHGERTEFHKPKAWQQIRPSLAQLNRWKPGWALAAVGGHTVDFIDVDDHHGGDVAEKEIRARGGWPMTFGVQSTPSGGRHYPITPLRERRAAGIAPGVDYQGGDESGEGRAFVWIAPTVKRSKNPEDGGALGTYAWVQEPDFEALKEYAGEESGQHIRDLVVASHSRTIASPSEQGKQTLPQVGEGISDDPFVTASQVSGGTAAGSVGPRRFTTDSAWEFVQPALKELRKAVVGEIEERANRAAVLLSHFVPAFMTPDDAFMILMDALSSTAYDPNGPSDWTAEKFRPVLDGRRPARDPWKAEKVEADSFAGKAAEVVASGDAVEAMLAELLSADEVAEREPPRSLVKGLLNLDSESWIIGEPGSKKSFVATDIAGHVALGKSWQGLKVTQGRVILIVAEGAGGMGPRLKAFTAEHGDRLPGKPVFSILPRPVQSADAGAWKVLVEVCRRMQPALVVIDTRARVTVGLEENSAKEMGIYVNAVSAIREATGACVLTVHHTGRKGGDARGSSAIDGAQTTELKIESEAGKLKGKLITEKQKDIEIMPALPLTFVKHVVGIDADGVDITSLALAGDAYKVASGQEEPAADLSEVEVPEPGDWTLSYVYSASAGLQRKLLETMRTVGGTVGRTQAEYRRIITERWYQKPKRLTESDWSKAWTAVVGATATLDGLPDEPVVIGQGGKHRLNPLAV